MKTIEPKKPLSFVITPEHVALADKHRKQPCYCTIAQALVNDGRFVAAVVRPTVTEIWLQSGNVARYLTPHALRVGLDNWDNNNDWDLKPGEYQLLPVPHSLKRKTMQKYYQDRKRRGDPNASGSHYPRRSEPRSPRTIATLAQMELEREQLSRRAKG